MFEVPSVADLNVAASLPVTLLALGACVFLLVDLFIPQDRKYITAGLAAGGMLVALVLALLMWGDVIELRDGDTAFSELFIADTMTHVVNIVVLITGLLGVLVAYNYLERTKIQRGEYYYLILFTTTGVMLMGGANDLAVVFVALELLSIPLYILSGFRWPQEESEESAMKYFLLGAFASSFLVYGIALIYGATGTTSLPGIWEAVNDIVAEDAASKYLLLLGSGLALVGLGFKVAAVPFHMWTPDVYQGAPTSVVAYMSVAAKVGGFAALIRVLVAGMPNFVLDGETVAAWQDTVWLVAALTMLLGNIVAIAQTELKRLLAYSSIAHAGYILIAVAAAGTASVADEAVRAVMIYLMAYAFTNVGAFAVVIALEKDDATNTGLDSVRGLARTNPLLAAAMTVFMLSLTGIPLTSGFVGKWFVFKAALSADLVPVAVIGVVTSLVSAFYYLRVVWLMYFEDGESEASTPWPLASAIGISVAGTLLLGFVPYLLSEMTNDITLAFGG
ncbi:MAG: NADH-quinone oxidoreductase subunit N [Chloroflexi bacterium]|nr:NADH-quinone oxidoreductase subunit N [Chloroflexota bacterium]